MSHRPNCHRSAAWRRPCTCTCKPPPRDADSVMVPLLPCPFCGSDSIGENGRQLNDEDGTFETAFCLSCLAEVPIAAWNNRHPAPALTAGEREALAYAADLLDASVDRIGTARTARAKTIDALVRRLAPEVTG